MQTFARDVRRTVGLVIVGKDAVTELVALLCEGHVLLEDVQGILPDQAERLISTAATVATVLLRAKQSAGLVTNGVTADQASLVRIDPSRSPTQLARMLETLAAVKPYSHVPIARVLHTVPQTLAGEPPLC